MTIHSSLRGADTLKGERSVLSRMERIVKLQKDGRFDPEKNTVWGLPKVRTRFKVATTKKPAADAPAAATPAADAAKK